MIIHNKFQTSLFTAVLIVFVSVSGARADLEVGADITHDVSHVASGGLKQGTQSRTLVNASVSAQLNQNWTFYADFWALRGGNGSDLVGDIQAFSNIDEDEFSRIYEIWMEASVDRFRVKTGFIDANTEFAAVDHGAEFINSSLGFTPTIGYMPSYPKPALALLGFMQTDFGELGIGAFSDESDSFDEVFTIGQFKTDINGILTQIGFWHQSGLIPQLDGTEQSGDTGLFLTMESDWDAQWFDSESMAWLIKLSTATENSLEIQQHVAAGIVFYSPFAHNNNQMGFTVTHVDIASDLRGILLDSETAIEWYYLWQINERLALKPDIQFIRSPAKYVTADDAWVFTLRMSYSL